MHVDSMSCRFDTQFITVQASEHDQNAILFILLTRTIKAKQEFIVLLHQFDCMPSISGMQASVWVVPCQTDEKKIRKMQA
jgi:hypothetical protein